MDHFVTGPFHPSLRLVTASVLAWVPDGRFDMVIATVRRLSQSFALLDAILSPDG